MTLNVAIQMDPIASINPKSDSTLAIGIEAQKRGHILYYYTPDTLSYHNGNVTAQAQPITLFADPARYYEFTGEKRPLDLSKMDVVLLRQDPPFNMTYLTTTYILEMLSPLLLPPRAGGVRGGTLVVNDPASVRNHPEKLFPTLLRQYMPETLITADVGEIGRFYLHHKDIIIKPLYGHGGRSIFRFRQEDGNFHTLMELQFAASKEPVVVQRFLPEVISEDRRIILIDGVVEGVMGRIPAEHEIRANLRLGGTASNVKLTPKQQEVCEAIGPMLKEKNILFAGLDMIGDYLTEVNITSPTGMVQMGKLYGTQPEVKLWDAIEGRF